MKHSLTGKEILCISAMTAETDIKPTAQTPEEGEVELKDGDVSREPTGLSPREGEDGEGEAATEGQVLSEDAEILKRELEKITVEPPKQM